ncbi:LysR substrate-binding domain-containing protein [Pseudoalteromonas luteoviolacea]|uniref:HTH lysR-type domain-containing protein n=1 Tax=Pseudoalteromonas luteoviolacea H33 TaxID=1365251 RepID=A0A162A5G7_9GAMM|nr:LysR substrate-binding domain-containing protein [Pseudoalteromonas luteoviolacea]KZN44473.1 hypothetical protein N476_05615 [Pseudoalteromonas luteoviolacea H33]KZN78490.1 hypothetical protein N477_08805 [Pseudoalteromonas luteoviolacea H33-S]MBQ4878034.1 LysR family transcriptional regulator [Pseudoalteromonas luteoviolacea]MBQ4907112.1 LysR family transcriptional regulator [Pseudoalteromonas luteoviolacea]
MSNLNLSLTALYTFSVVAKELNFTVAAGILHISPSAVSHQMKLLESQLGMSLFHRKSKGVILTPEAVRLYEHVSKGFNVLEHGVVAARRSTQVKRIVLAVIPSLLEHWLIPKLGEFYQCYPHIELNLIAQDQLIDFNCHHVDAHLHFGHGQYQGLNCTRLASEWAYPVCSPNYLKALDEDAPLLSYQGGMEDAPGCINWQTWLEQHYVDGIPNQNIRTFSHLGHTLTAAKYSQGIALGWHHIAIEMLAQGALVKLPYEPMLMPFSYFFVTDQNTCNSEALTCLLTWLKLKFIESSLKIEPN